MCSRHYRLWRYHGTPTPKVLTPEDRFWSHVDKSGDCWLWTLGCNPEGYADLKIDGKTWRGHRYAYELLVGPIPERLHLDHICHDPDTCKLSRTCPHRRCVNPAHLRPSTAKANVLRGNTLPAANVVKTHCPQGHPYDGANLYHSATTNRRHCRTCARDRARRRRALQRHQAAP